jgi:O-antigen/teichoic acid export membrane protein
MKNLFTDFSEKRLSLVTGLVFMCVGIYDLMITNHLISGTKFIISASLFCFIFYKIKSRLDEEKKKKFRAGYGLLIIGSFVSVLGGIITHIIWVLGIILLVRTIVDEKVDYES